MQSAGAVRIHAAGDLYRRARANLDRLERPDFRPPAVFKQDYDWPGDTEGRTILALARLGRALDLEPRYLDSILAALPDHLNERGYFGPVRPRGVVDEQQLCSHTWVLRGLSEVYRSTGRQDVLDRIEGIVSHLLVPATANYAAYPVRRDRQAAESPVVGQMRQDLVDNWYVSTDISCAFALLDGAAAAYELLPTTPLRQFIEVLVDSFAAVDLLAISAQTHSTLSTLRGLLRYYDVVREHSLLHLVQDRYDLYIREALTENYANYNWFGRPLWTEPCAIIDSFIVAVGLWRHTGISRYLDDAHHIYYNAICPSQRPNGGFGCDTCLGAADVFLAPVPSAYEASWCCTMRGGEGLAEAIESIYAVDAECLTVNFYHDNAATVRFLDGDVDLRLATGYPIEGHTGIRVVRSTLAEAKTIRFFVPGWVDAAAVTLEVDGKPVGAGVSGGYVEAKGLARAGEVIAMRFPIQWREAPTMNARSIGECRTIRHGPLILGTNNGSTPVLLARQPRLERLDEAVYRVEAAEATLAPLAALVQVADEWEKTNRKQALFRGV